MLAMMDRTMAAIETALAVTLLPHFIADPPLGWWLMPLHVGNDGQDDGGDRNGTCGDFASPLHSRSSSVLRYELPNHQPYVTTHPPSQELLEDTAGLWWQKKEAAADVDKLETLDYGGCRTDLKGAWTDVEENLNACEKGSHGQSWSPSRAVMSMTCRNTTAIIDPAVRMNSTLYGVFFSMLKLSLVHIPFLSSPRIA
jgi:hypothetical protein